MFEEFSKSRDIFRTQASIYDGAFCEYTLRLTIFAIKGQSYYFRNKRSIIELRLGYYI